MHPNRGEALSSSRSKMRAITGTGGGGSPHMGMSPFKRPDGQGVTKSYHSHDKQFVAHGGKVKKRGDKFARGGRTKPPPKPHPDEGDQPGKYEWPIESRKGGAIRRAEGGPISHMKKDAKEDKGVKNYAPEGSEKYGWFSRLNKGGAAKRADGGRTNPFMPRPTTSTGGSRKSIKGKGNITVNLMMPQHHHPAPTGGLGGMGAPPGGPPIGGPGGPGGAPAAAPMNPLAAAGAMGAPGGMPPGGMPGGANPQAMQALQAIAGGGGGLGGGMPGRGPFARGGAAKSTGLTSNMAHWKNYASKNVKHNTAHERGATGESEELALKTPVAKRAAGGKVKVKAHSRGGPTRRAGGGSAPFGRNRSDPSGIPSIGRDWIGPGADYGGGKGSQD